MKQKRLKCLILMAVTVVIVSCGEKIEPGNTTRQEGPSVKVPVAMAEVIQHPYLYEAVGTINASTASTISGKLMGTVLSVHVNEGDKVIRKDLLVTLDPRQVKAQLDKARAGRREAKRAQSSAVSARDAAKASAQLAKATFLRYKKLLEENSVSQQEFEEVEARHRQAQATLAQTEAMLEAARSRIHLAQAAEREAGVAEKDAQVRAPYDGRIVNKLINEGDLASPGMPFLTIEQEGQYTADLVLPERHIRHVYNALEVKVVVDALDHLALIGKVSRVIPSADTLSRSFQIKVGLPETPELKSGMFARVSVPIGGTGMLMVPQTAVKAEGQLNGVFIVDENQTARFRLVRTGQVLADRVQIISGLKQGQRYVTVISPKLENGCKVEAGK
ncbi:MAG: efflux RND transporter periplasmic adaptor subunit [Desulfobacteraceae bacterium]|nr:efflux RND transporter periplasmic adaptor subunit [Desulfobacteraceae bacterium]